MSGSAEAAALVVAFVVLLLIVLLVRSARSIAPYQQGIVVMFGSFRRVLNPGLSFVSPLAVVLRVDLRTQSTALRPQTLMTRDQRVVAVEGELRYRVVDAPKATFQTTDYRTSLLQEADLAVQAELRDHDFAGMLADPHSVNDRLTAAISAATTMWGVRAEAVTVRLREPGAGGTFPLRTPLASGPALPEPTYDGGSARRVGG